jgi:hypothetical protein
MNFLFQRKKPLKGIAALTTVIGFGTIILLIGLATTFLAFYASENSATNRQQLKLYYGAYSGLQDQVLFLERTGATYYYTEQPELVLDGMIIDISSAGLMPNIVVTSTAALMPYEKTLTGEIYANLLTADNIINVAPIIIREGPFRPLTFKVGSLNTNGGGGDHTCAVKNGLVYCWGDNDYCDQLGDGSRADKSYPVLVKGVGGSGYLTEVAYSSAGHLHTCAAKTDGTLYCWGCGGRGELGIGTLDHEYTPVQVKGVGGEGYLTNVSSVSSGNEQTCAVTTNGTLYCWGDEQGLGVGDCGAYCTTPYQVKGVGGSGYLTGVSQVSVKGITISNNFICAVKTDGTLYCWGYNYHGQLGIDTFGDSAEEPYPVQVKGVGGSGYLTDVSQVSLGDRHTCALKTNGTVYCWGANDIGQLGDNTTTERHTPVQVKGVGGVDYLTNVSQISLGYGHACALKTNGTVYCWGYNSSGQLGDNTTTNRYTPVQVKGVGGVDYLTNVSQISTGDYFSCARKTDGTVYCWGDNDNGQLGDNTTTERQTPVQVIMGEE